MTINLTAALTAAVAQHDVLNPAPAERAAKKSQRAMIPMSQLEITAEQPFAYRASSEYRTYSLAKLPVRKSVQRFALLVTDPKQDDAVLLTLTNVKNWTVAEQSTKRHDAVLHALATATVIDAPDKRFDADALVQRAAKLATDAKAENADVDKIAAERAAIVADADADMIAHCEAVLVDLTPTAEQTEAPKTEPTAQTDAQTAPKPEPTDAPKPEPKPAAKPATSRRPAAK